MDLALQLLLSLPLPPPPALSEGEGCVEHISKNRSIDCLTLRMAVRIFALQIDSFQPCFQASVTKIPQSWAEMGRLVW